MIEIVLFLVILLFILMRRGYRKHNESSLFFERVQIVLTAVAIGNILLTWVTALQYPYICSYIRPIMLIINIRIIREYWNRYLLVIYDTLPMTIFMVVYLLYFSWLGQRLFNETLEGSQYFKDFGSATWHMLVLLTTTNYPDVMLPAYGSHRYFYVYFGIYLIVGLILLFNMLLAIFYSNYTNRFQQSISDYDKDREEYLSEMFQKLDKEKKGYLDNRQVFKMMSEIHSLV